MLIAAGLFPAGGGPAQAHAIVLAADPAEGARLPAGSAVAVTLRFNSRIDHARSRLLAIGPDGTETALPLAASDDPVVLLARTPPLLAPGAWRLRWQVLARDGHITRGEIRFTVDAAAAAAPAPR